MAETPDIERDDTWARSGDLSKLSEREAELVRRAGERIFSLSRELAAAELEAGRLKQESHHALRVAAELRLSRDSLARRVTELESQLFERQRALQVPVQRLSEWAKAARRSARRFMGRGPNGSRRGPGPGR
jgi:chromosome segregation ATPase